MLRIWNSLARDSSSFYLGLAIATVLYISTYDSLNHFIIFDSFALFVSALFYIPIRNSLFAIFGYCCANCVYFIYYTIISQIIERTDWSIVRYMGYQCILRSLSFTVFTLMLIWHKKTN